MEDISVVIRNNAEPVLLAKKLRLILKASCQVIFQALKIHIICGYIDMRKSIDRRCNFIRNLSENAIRPFAVGRKNWLFSNPVDGIRAVVYTIVKITTAHDINILQIPEISTGAFPNPKRQWATRRAYTLERKTPICQKLHVNYNELFQLTKDWDNFVSDRTFS